MSIFRLYPGFKLSFEHNSVRKNLFLSACSVRIQDFLYVRWTKNLNLVEPLVMGTRTWNYYFVISKYLDYTQYYLMPPEQCGHIVAKDVVTVTWLDEDQIHVCSVYWMFDWITNSCLTGLLFCLYVKIFLPSIFKSVDFWNSMSCIVLDIELTEKYLIKELGLYIDGSVQGFSFCPPKSFKPNKQTTWNTSQLHGIAWSSGKLDYEKLFAVFYDIKVMNAEVFAKRLEKYRLLTNLLGRNVENLDDYGCPRIQDFVKTDSSWIEVESLEFVRGVNFEFIDSLKNNGTKYLLFFDDSCEEIFNSKAFVTTHRRLITLLYNPPDPFPQNFISRNDWNSQKFWTMNTQNFSTLQVFQSFSHKCKSLFLQSCPKEFIRFLCECIINLLKGNLQSMKRHHVVKFQSEVRLLSLKRTTWKQRRDILASERGLQLIKVITPPVIDHLSWYGPVCLRSCFCV